MYLLYTYSQLFLLQYFFLFKIFICNNNIKNTNQLPGRRKQAHIDHQDAGELRSNFCIFYFYEWYAFLKVTSCHWEYVQSHGCSYHPSGSADLRFHIHCPTGPRICMVDGNLSSLPPMSILVCLMQLKLRIHYLNINKLSYY